MSHPLKTHSLAIKKILRYLKGSHGHGLLLSPLFNFVPPSLYMYYDVDWASNHVDRGITLSAPIYFGNNLISWWSKKQPMVASSSTEAGYRGLGQDTTDLLWVKTLLKELFVSSKIPLVVCNNQSTIMLAHNPTIHLRNKHMEIDFFFVREKC